MRAWARWHQPQRRLMPSILAPWLTDTGSLTRCLQAHNQHDFSIQLLGNHWIKPLIDECQYLNMSTSALAYQREVLLMDGVFANVYARTVIPRATFMPMQYRFNNLGNKPLGELLFTDAFIERGSIEIACLTPGQYLYEMAVRNEKPRPEELWARRSLFNISGKKLLVNEIFLPALERG